MNINYAKEMDKVIARIRAEGREAPPAAACVLRAVQQRSAAGAMARF
jgi:hypothetical protein